jgi:electron transport complex protein RnfG
VFNLEQTLKARPAGLAGGFQNSNLAQAWLILVLALIFGAALAAVQVNLSQTIKNNKLQETLERIPELIWGAAKAGEIGNQGPALDITPGTIAVAKDGKTSYYQMYRVSLAGRLSGWVIKAGGQGYADKIEILIGLDPAAKTISGIFILEQKETPGLGNKISFARWRNQFIGKSTASPLTVIKSKNRTPGSIDAVTGATISSRSVTGIVNRTIDDIKGRLNPANIRFSERQP